MRTSGETQSKPVLSFREEAIVETASRHWYVKKDHKRLERASITPKTGKSCYSLLSSIWNHPDSTMLGQCLPLGISISDNEIAFRREPYIKTVGFIDEVFVRPRGSPDQTVCKQVGGQADNCGQPEFVSNDVLALWIPHSFTPNIQDKREAVFTRRRISSFLILWALAL